MSKRQEQDRQADTQGHWIKIASLFGILGRRMVREEMKRIPKDEMSDWDDQADAVVGVA